MARTGTDYDHAIQSLDGLPRDAVTLDFFQKNDIPSYLLTLVPIELKEIVKGKERSLLIYASPDFLMVGSDQDPFYAPVLPTTAQTMVDAVRAILPSKKLAREIYKHADVKLSIYDANPGEPWYDLKNSKPRRIEASGAWSASNKRKLGAVMLNIGASPRPTTLVAGHQKDLITGPGLDGSHVRIYGGGGGTNDGWAVQPPSTIHEWSYGPDYSHGLRFISRDAFLDGHPVDLYDIFRDPDLSQLVSDEGPYEPRFPTPKGYKAPLSSVSDRSRASALSTGQQLGAETDFLVLGALGAGLLLAGRLGRTSR